MAEVDTMFRNKMNGYNKEEVNLYVKDREEKLQEKDATITSLNEQVAELQKQLAEAQEAAKLAAETPAPAPAEDSDPILDAEIAEKAEKFDLLMKRWGDEEMGPAIAKKKVILEEAERAADVFYEKSAEKVAACLDADFAKLAEALRADLDAYLYSKSLAGRVKTCVDYSKRISAKIAAGLHVLFELPGKVYKATSERVNEATDRAKAMAATYKAHKAASKAQ